MLRNTKLQFVTLYPLYGNFKHEEEGKSVYSVQFVLNILWSLNTSF